MKSRKFISFIVLIIILIAAGVFFVRHEYFWGLLGIPLHKNIINKYSGEYKFDPLFIMALVKAESNFQKHAESPRGAIGLMQILPSTAEEMAKELGMENFNEKLLKKPEINIKLGFHYLNKLRNIFGDNKVEILTAYNAGLLRAIEWKKGKDKLTLDDIEFQETKEFIEEVLSNYEKLKKIQKIKKIIQTTPA